MPIYEGLRGLEWSHLFLYDKHAIEDLPEDFDPTAQVVLSTPSTLIVRGLPESEGDVHLVVAFTEAVDLTATPVSLATGHFVASSGEIVGRTSSWDDEIALSVPPGSYKFDICADHGEWPRRLVLRFS